MKQLKFVLLLAFLPLFSSGTSCDNMLNFPGFNSYVNCGPAIALNPESGITVQAWIYTLDASFNQKIAGNIDPFTNSGYELAIDSNMLYCEIKDTSGVLTFFRAGQINANEWTHVAFSYKVNGTMKGYINGNEIISIPVSSTPIGNTGTTNFIIGSAPWDQNYFNFNGNIDEVKIFSSQISIDQIREEMRMIYSGTLPGLIGYWKFAEGSGTTTADLSGQNNNGTLYGLNTPTWTASDGPYGSGFSELQIISCCNFYNFDPANLRLDIDITNLTGTDTLVVSYIQCDPGGSVPSGSTDYVFGYWVLDKYGSPGVFNGRFDFTLGSGMISPQDEATPGNLKLYTRNPNATGTWTIWNSASTASSSSGLIQFAGASLNQQIVIGTTGNSPLEINSIPPALDFSLSPNPVNQFLNLQLDWNGSEPLEVQIYNSYGQQVHHGHFLYASASPVKLNCTEFSSGIYTILILSKNGKGIRKFIVE